MGREGLHPGCALGTQKVLWAIMLVSMALCSRKIHRVHAAPVLGPDLTRCNLIIENDAPLDCCFLPPKRPQINFQFNIDLPMRVRRSIHNVDQAYIEKLNRAYEMMKALPDDDPRSFLRQAKSHCAYCSEIYRQVNSTEELKVHKNWLLMPFHRLFVYFHERILASLLGDDTFALPFWQWDNQLDVHPPSNLLPSMYVDRRNVGLFDEKRSPAHQPPAIVDLTFWPFGPPAAVLSPEEQRAANRNVLYTSIVSGAPTPLLFLGQPFRGGDAPLYGGSAFENQAHDSVHYWIGDEREPHREDMTRCFAAARDPIFFTHHANVDRLWDLWKHLPGGHRGDLTDPDWLNSEFIFYDENADLVRVKVADSLDIEKLRYRYEEVENDWLWFNSTRLSTKPAPVPVSSDCAPKFFKEQLSRGIAKLARFIVPSLQTERTSKDCDLIATRGSEVFHIRNIPLTGAVFQAHISRPAVPIIIQTKEPEAFGLQPEEPGSQEEVLAIEGIRIPSGKSIGFVLFLNLPDADEHTPWSCTEYAGAFYPYPTAGNSREHTRSRDHSFRVGISSKLKQLGLEKEPSILVSLVPRSKDTAISIHSIRIELAQ